MSKYALALVAALGSGLAAPAWAQGYGCCGSPMASSGCLGGWTPVTYGCYGSGCMGSGCYGGWHTMGGWTPVSYGGMGSGCYGGWTPVTSGCYGSSCMGSGCYGGWHTIGNWTPVTYGCYGSGCIGAGCYGSSVKVVTSSPRTVVSAPSEVVTRVAKPVKVQRQEPKPADPPAQPKVVKKAQAETLGMPEAEASGPAPATLVVQLPAQARLTINHKACQADSPTRTFVSPPLQPGKDYYYTLQAEIDRDGRKVLATQRVAVRAGEEKQVLLAFPPTDSRRQTP